MPPLVVRQGLGVGVVVRLLQSLHRSGENREGCLGGAVLPLWDDHRSLWRMDSRPELGSFALNRANDRAHGIHRLGQCRLAHGLGTHSGTPLTTTHAPRECGVIGATPECVRSPKFAPALTIRPVLI